MIQAVVDTNVIVAGLRSRRGASFALLELIGKSDHFGINVSVPLVLEYEAVLLRQRAQIGLSREDVGDVIDYLCSVAKLHDIYYLWRPVLKDPKDDFVLELAVRAECTTIVTHNLGDFAQCDRFGIAAVTPRDFLTTIRRKG